MSLLVVTKDIPLGDPGRGVYAFRVGDKVAASEVQKNGWEDHVASPTTKAAKQAAGAVGGEKE